MKRIHLPFHIRNCIDKQKDKKKIPTDGTGYARIVKRRMQFADSR